MTGPVPNTQVTMCPPRRWLRRVLLAVAGLLIALFLAGVVVVGNLDRPWVKRRVQAIVRDAAGVELDYAATRVRVWGGLALDGLVVRAPEPVRAAAPELARVGRVRVAWSPASLLGAGPKLERVVLEDVALTLVVDEDGRTSLSYLGGAEPSPPSPSPPPSRLAAELFGGSAPVGRVAVEGVRVAVLRRAAGRVVERLGLDGLRLEAETAREGGGWRALVRAGGRLAPLELRLDRRRGEAAAGAAEARLWLELTASPAQAEVALALDVTAQSLAPELKVAHLIAAEATARFGEGKVAVALTKAQLADGAATAEGAVAFPDGGAPMVERAQGDVDLVRVLALVPSEWAPVPVAVRAARLRYEVARLVASAPPRLEPGGTASLDGAVQALRVTAPELRVSADEAKVALAARAEASGATTLRLRAPLSGLVVEAGRRRVAGDQIAVSAEGVRDGAGAWTGDAGITLAALSVGGAERIAVTEGRLGLRARALEVDPAVPLATRGQLGVEGGARVVELVAGGAHARAQGLTLTARAGLSGRAPYALDAEVPVAHLRLSQADGRRLVDGPARVAVRLTDAFPDALAPLRSRAAGRVTAQVGPLTATVDATKRPDGVDFRLTADAPSLAPLRLVVGGGVPWDKIGLAVRSRGTVARLGSASPAIDHHTEVTLEHPAWPGGSARHLALALASKGTARRHDVNADLRVRGLALAGARAGDGHVTLAAGFDAAAPSLTLRLASDGEGSPDAKLALSLGFERARKAVTFDVGGRLGRLGALAPLAHAAGGLDGLDLSRLAVSVESKGTLFGVIDDVSEDGVPRPAPRPLATVGAEGAVTLRATRVRYSAGESEVRVPEIAWRGELTRADGRQRLSGALSASALHVVAGAHRLDASGIRDTLDVSLQGGVAAGEGTLSHRLTIDRLDQDLARGYPTGDLALAVSARRDGDGVVHIDALSLKNPAGGSTLTLTGGVDLGGARRSLSLEGRFEQDLARPLSDRRAYLGRGRATVALRVDSGNLRLYHTLALLKVSDATVKLPRAGIEVEAADGEIPVSADLVAGEHGLALLRDAQVNAYSELRFADQHPLMSRRSFISVKRIVTPWATVAPLGGNLRVDHNVVSLSQLEMGLRGGRVTGQCILDYEGEDSRVQLHVRASGVEASRGERFDGNAAVAIDVKDRNVEGRAEVLRIGRRHLLDLLELQDPRHADPAINRVRRALQLGYPDKLRLAFKHGFVSARVTFGGLARLVRLDELRGIPIGPLVDKVLAQLSPPKEEEP